MKKPGFDPAFCLCDL